MMSSPKLSDLATVARVISRWLSKAFSCSWLKILESNRQTSNFSFTTVLTTQSRSSWLNRSSCKRWEFSRIRRTSTTRSKRRCRYIETMLPRTAPMFRMRQATEVSKLRQTCLKQFSSCPLPRCLQTRSQSLECSCSARLASGPLCTTRLTFANLPTCTCQTRTSPACKCLSVPKTPIRQSLSATAPT